MRADLEIRHHEKLYVDPPEKGWVIFMRDPHGDESYVDHDWYKGCAYWPIFPPPLWGFFPTYQHAAKAICDLGWIDRIIQSQAPA
jgi:hypothetical protein